MNFLRKHNVGLLDPILRTNLLNRWRFQKSFLIKFNKNFSTEQNNTKNNESDQSDQSRRKSRPISRLLFLTALVSSPIAFLVSQKDANTSYQDAISDAIDTIVAFPEQVVRFFRAAYAVSMVIRDYKVSFKNVDRGTPEFDELLKVVSKRSADRLLSLCLANAGVYTKAGQFVASMAFLPTEYTSILGVLQDQNTPTEYKLLVKMFKREFHANPENIFEKFETEPIASASIAQVHRAKLKSGEEVAVKIQHYGLERTARNDLKSINLLGKLLAWQYPNFEYTFLIPEFERFLNQEIDFVNEGRNCEKTGKNFANNSQVRVPKILWNYTTKRVLTMEFMEGIKINDTKALDDLKLDKNDVSRLFMEVVSEQIFVHGFLHGDPHPGNVLVRKENGKPLIILLDHGLYQQLPDALRLNYCHLWRSIIFQNKKDIEKYARILGGGENFRLFERILTAMPENAKTHVKMSTEERQKMWDQFKVQGFGVAIREWLENIPRDLLVVFKTQSLLPSLNRQIGANSRNRFDIMAKYALKGIYKEKRKSWFGWFQEMKDLVSLKFIFTIYDWAIWIDERLRIFGLQ